ncbi:MAG: hypothetical protein N2383_08195 [Caldilineales bacterium]|nr:hypothetical protein [Caldilineales bacterium]
MPRLDTPRAVIPPGPDASHRPYLPRGAFLGPGQRLARTLPRRFPCANMT